MRASARFAVALALSSQAFGTDAMADRYDAFQDGSPIAHHELVDPPAPPATDDPLAAYPATAVAESWRQVASFIPIEPGSAAGMLGRDVGGIDGKTTIGKLIDVMVDGDGKPVAAIIDFGGFLGVGSRKIAVDWRLLQFRPDNHDRPVLLAIDRQALAAAPAIADPANPGAMVGPPAAPRPSGTDDAAAPHAGE